MTIYHVDCEDQMNSTFSNSRETLGYFVKRDEADTCAKDYNKALHPSLRNTSFRAIVTPIEVKV